MRVSPIVVPDQSRTPKRSGFAREMYTCTVDGAVGKAGESAERATLNEKRDGSALRYLCVAGRSKRKSR